MDQNHAIAALGALAQDSRLALFRLLVTAGPEGLSAGTIAERLRGAPASPSLHLQQPVPARAGPEGLSAGTIAERLGVAPSSLSFHLQQLLHAGLVTQRRLSRQLIYAAEYGAMNGLIAYLTENCCGQGISCAPACTPAETFAEGEPDEALSRSRLG